MAENQTKKQKGNSLKWLTIGNLNDDPVDDDGFGFKALAQEVGELIPSFKPPKGLAIVGPWGAGKTSFLKIVRKKLQKDHNTRVRTVWFDAWKYQNEEEPIVALLQTIRAELDWAGDVNSFKPEKFMASLALDAFSKAISVKKTLKEHRENEFLEKLPTDKLNKVLEEVIKWMTEDNKKLVIFIDDLDRCHGDGMVKLLDGIMHYLSLANCIVVFGINVAMLGRVMQEKTGDDIHLAKEYFEKICRQTIQLPIPGHDVRAEYFTRLCREIKLSEPFGAENLKGLIEYLMKYWVLPPIPRKIKSFANTVAFFAKHHWEKIDQKKMSERDLKTLILVSGLYHFHTEIYTALSSQTFDYYVNNILKFAQGEDMSDHKEFEHLKLRQGFRIAGEKAAIPKGDLELYFTYVNAHDTKVFRLQALVLDLNEVKYEVLHQWFIKAKL